MTYVSIFDTIHAEAQQEAFAQLKNAGRRVLVVFSHVFSTHYLNNNKIRKGAFTQLSHSSPDGSPRRVFINSNQGGKNSLPVTGRNASANMKSNLTNLVLIIS